MLGRPTIFKSRISKGLFEKVGFKLGPIVSQEKKEWSYYAEGKKKSFNIRYSIRDALGQEIIPHVRIHK